MITTQKEKAFAMELKELMEKHGVRIETEEVLSESSEPTQSNELKQEYKFSGPDIDIAIGEFELWRNISSEVKEVKSAAEVAQLRNSAA